MTSAPRDEYLRWLESPLLSDGERAELASLGPAAAAERFDPPLHFGTAGVRAPVGPGSAFLNRFTVARLARALGQCLLSRGADFARAGVCIGFDSRTHSSRFARTAADVLCSMSIPVFLFPQPCPTPQLAFAVRSLHAAAGLCVTASHNPPRYNGCKIYWQGGAQIPDSLAADIAQRMHALDALCPPPAPCEKGLTLLDGAMDESFVRSAVRCADLRDIALFPALRIVYTPFHGVGGRLATRAFALAGLSRVLCVPEQFQPDGTFPTTPVPNPEDPSGFGPALQLAGREHADLILANDPDADRIAVWAADRTGAMRPLSGNQIGVLLTDYLLREPSDTPRAIVKTLVSTDMARLAAQSRGGLCFDVFTGFKFLSAQVQQLESRGIRTVLAFEEAIGYMLNPDVPDKDGISAALVIAAMACRLRARGLTLHDRLLALSSRLGFHAERTVSLTLPGAEGRSAMRRCMESLRAQPPACAAGCRVVRFDDFLCGRSVQNGCSTTLSPSGSDVVRLHLANGCTLIIRPSGTEPKIKMYVLSRADTARQAASQADACAQDALRIVRLENYTGQRSMKIL